MIVISKTLYVEFMRRTARIKINEIMPILAYSLLEVGGGKGSLTKTNLSIFCEYRFDATGKIKILLDENVMATLCSVDNAMYPDITITVDDKGIVTVTDGLVSQEFETISVSEYPKMQAKTGKKQTVSKDTIDRLLIAANYVSKDEAIGAGAFTLAHCHKNDVFAMNSMSMFHYQFGGEVPDMMLPAVAIAALSGYDEMSFYDSPGMNFFESIDTTVGFTKMDYSFKAPPTYAHFLNVVKTGGLKINKAQLEKFCEITIAICGNKVAVPVAGIFRSGVGQIKLRYAHDAMKKTNEMVLLAEGGDTWQPFYFNVAEMLRALRPLPYDYVSFGRNTGNPNHCYLYSDTDANYTGFFAGVNNAQ